MATALISLETKSKEKDSVTNFNVMEINDMFHTKKSACLTSAQKNLFDNNRHAIIRGIAGSGKTLLTLLKVINITKPLLVNVIILAPYPHHVRCEKILLANNVNVEIMREFAPILSTTTSKVFVMELEYFFNVDRRQLMKYDLTGYNLFIDGMQPYYTTDIADFVERTYIESKRNQLYLWITLDASQRDEEFAKLFCKYIPLPSITLTEMLRNTTEIAKVVLEARCEGVPSQVISNIEFGHQMTTGETVQYHKLKQGTNEHLWKVFLCERIWKEVDIVTRLIVPPLLPSDVTIVFKDAIGVQGYLGAIEKTLLKKFNIQRQNIEQYLVGGDRVRMITDVKNHVTSHESRCVILLRTREDAVFHCYSHYYNVFSRAQERLIIIDIETDKPALPYSNINLIIWQHDNKNKIFYKI